VAVPFLVYLALTHQFDIFKWLLTVSFFTDAIDGYFARKYKIESALGARIDSIADDLTIAAAIVGMYLLYRAFLLKEIVPIIILLVLYFLQNTVAFIKYGRMTSFHTYIAKIAAVLQGLFVMAFFFLPHPIYWLFYLAFVVTAIDLVEETILVFLIPRFKTDVKGLYWLKAHRSN